MCRRRKGGGSQRHGASSTMKIPMVTRFGHLFAQLITLHRAAASQCHRGMHIQKRDSLLETATFQIISQESRPEHHRQRKAPHMPPLLRTAPRSAGQLLLTSLVRTTRTGVDGKRFGNTRPWIFEKLPAGLIERDQQEFNTTNVCVRSCQSTAVIRHAVLVVLPAVLLWHKATGEAKEDKLMASVQIQCRGSIYLEK